MRVRLNNKSKWHKWFAWHPVRIGNKLVWFEIVMRKGRYEHPDYGIDLCDIPGGWFWTHALVDGWR